MDNLPVEQLCKFTAQAIQTGKLLLVSDLIEKAERTDDTNTKHGGTGASAGPFLFILN